MNLRDYEQTKFALAEIVRSAILRGTPERRRDLEAAGADIFARLAEDRFLIGVVGRFNRGKTSLMNALLSTRRLPVDILPLTSTITTVSYGSSELATIEYYNRSLPDRVPLGDISAYVTEAGNPGNARGVKAAHAQLPAELLRRGFYLVDTPGIGSTPHNDRTTQNFLPEADAVILVTSFESPLSEDELEIVKILRSCGRHIFYVINKKDLVSADDCARVLAYVRSVLGTAGIVSPDIFSVSSHPDRSEGIKELGLHLVKFLTERKSEAFLGSMRDRIADLLNALPPAENERSKLRALFTDTPSRDQDAYEPALASSRAPTFSKCLVCEGATRAVVDYLCVQQYELTASTESRTTFAVAGGFCPKHTWQYSLLANARAGCIATSAVIDHLATDLRNIVAQDDGLELIDRIDDILRSKERCQACQVMQSAECEAIENAARAAHPDGRNVRAAYCLRHFRDVVAAAPSREVARSLVEGELDAMEHVAEDTRRYVLKIDGVRRFLLSADEREADQRGLALLAGSRGVNGIATP